MSDVADALASLATVESLALTTADPDMIERLRRRAAVLTGVDLGAIGMVDSPAPALDPSTDRAGSDAERVATAVAEQFVIDVAGVDDPMRARLGAQFGSATFGLVQAIYVADYVPRVRWTLWRLLDLSLPPVAVADGDLWAALEEFMRAVARLDRLDPVLTELVRLRGARVHNCRLCQSLRNVTAVAGGVDEGTATQVDRYESSPFPERTKVALRLTDAIISRPGEIDGALIESVDAHFEEGEVIELVLDVMRNAGNKIAVCLGADAAHVADGIEFYDIDPSGEPIYGLDLHNAKADH